MALVSMLLALLCTVHYAYPTAGTRGMDQPVTRQRKVLADLTSNKLTREHDGSFGLWSFHGTALSSHADKREFTYNADLLSEDGQHHVSIASTVYPWMGLTSDRDPLFQEYLFLQAKVSAIDGFLLEWGYREHSSNAALQELLKVAKKYPGLVLGVNWCDHWLTEELQNCTSQEVVDTFHSNLQYLVDNVFVLGPEVTLYHGNHPIIFLFGGGLKAEQFKEVLLKPLSLPPGMATPIWIGSFLNFASSQVLWEEWGGLLNGTFGWAPHKEKPTPANMSQWDYYGTLQDAVDYQRKLSSFGQDCVAKGSCLLWCGSASPGFDNRGCAGWGGSLRYLPRLDMKTHSRRTYNAQWEFYLGLDSSPDFLILPTMNDFPEATAMLPLSSGMEVLQSTARLASKWKNASLDAAGVALPANWYGLCSLARFYSRTPHLNVSDIISSLEKTAALINRTIYSEAFAQLQAIRKDIDMVESQLKTSKMTFDLLHGGLYPSVKPTVSNGSYVVSRTVGLFLAMQESRAKELREANFKGLLRFDYLLQSGSLAKLKVMSSTARDGRPVRREPVTSRSPQGHRPPSYQTDSYIELGNFAEVCDITVTSSGIWQSAVVALYKVNQAWDHSAQHTSDLHFVADSSFLVRNIILEFEVFSVRSTG